MIKNKELLEIVEKEKKEISCNNCKHCNLRAYHSGKWYCNSPRVSIFNLPPDMGKCFERRGME